MCQCILPSDAISTGSLAKKLAILTVIILIFLPNVLSQPLQQTTPGPSLRYDHVAFTVLEEQPPGTVVGTLPVLHNLQYRFNVAQTMFSLDTNTGVIKTLVVINREALPSSVITLLVQSIPAPPVHIIQVVITVVDINDNSPVFPDSQISVSFVESDQPGTHVILETATDSDSGGNGNISNYKIVSGNEAGRFQLLLVTDTSKPLLYLENAILLNREQQASYTLNISAQDSGSPPRFGYLTVDVAIQDINDNPPVFSQNQYNATLGTSAAIGSFVVRVNALDKDSNQNAAVTYSIVVDDGQQFKIDPVTGVITTTKILICSSTCQGSSDPNCRANTCVLMIKASDGGQPVPLMAYANVAVTLLDENVHAPVITFQNRGNATSLLFDESVSAGSIVEALSVTDADAGQGELQTPQIVGGNQLGDFRLDPSGISGLSFIILNRQLDVTRSALYNLTIVASDLGSPPSTSVANLIIVVGQKYRNPPKFDTTSASVLISDLSPIGSYVTSVLAHVTADIISYSITAGNDLGWFYINPASGLITTQSILSGSPSSIIQLTIAAANGAYSAFINITVTIVVGYDISPTFTSGRYNASVVDGAAPGTAILTISAYYGIEGGSVGDIIYALGADVANSYYGIFLINNKTGSLTTLQSIDRQKFSSFQFTVIAINAAYRHLFSSTVVFIQVVAVYDKPPIIFPVLYYVRIPNLQMAGFAVAKIRATDLGSGQTTGWQYTILDGASNTFAIDSTSGWVRTTRQVSWLMQSFYRLSITVQDAIGLSATQNSFVYIYITNSTQSTIFFPQSGGYSYTIVEDDSRLETRMTRSIGPIVASALNSVQHTTYSIIDGDPMGVFTIGNASGVISSTQPVDREIQAFYTLIIVGVLGQQDFNTIAVNITITDVNDNAPSFVTSPGLVNVDENRPAGEIVYAVRAVDPDNGLNGTVRYYLATNSSRIVVVDSVLGLLTLALPLEGLSMQQYTIFIIATDLGSPPLSSMLTVTMVVQPVYDYTPTFSLNTYNVAINESSPVNKRFYPISSDNLAIYSNNLSIFYEIIYGNNDGRIKIFPDGLFYVASALDREVTDMYVITVKASIDSVNGLRSSTADFVVVVTDTNDNDPYFWNQTYSFVIVEESPSVNFAALFLASDADIGANAELIFSIEDNAYGFRVDPLTSLLTTWQVWDREQIVSDPNAQDSGIIQLLVVVNDCGNPSRSSQVIVTVTVSDINDNAPVFSQSAYTVVIAESTPVGSIVASVNATDPDAGQNGTIRYFISSGNKDGEFSLDYLTGQVTLTGQLDAERKDVYTLAIIAEDLGIPYHLSGSAVVHIFVEDVNDELPMWDPNPLEVLNISRYTIVGQNVYQVTAVDNDVQTSSELSYSIFSFTSTGLMLPFVMESNSGRIYLNRSLIYDQRNQYVVVLSVVDTFGPPFLSATATLTLNIVNYNDDAPQFIRQPTTYHVTPMSPIGTTVCTVRAIDYHAGINSIIEYSIDTQIPSGNQFSIDRNTGDLIVSGPFMNTTAKSFMLILTASNVAVPAFMRLNSQQLITVIIDDTIGPEFWAPNTAVIPLGSIEGYLVSTVKAVDIYTAACRPITYRIVRDDSQLFVMDDNLTGQVRLRYNLSSTISNSHNLTLAASNNALPPTESIFPFVVLIGSGNGPTFTSSSYLGQVYENQASGSSVVSVLASYPSNPGAIIAYYITNITSRGDRQPLYFQIQMSTGLITTTQVLDREAGYDTFLIVVYAVERNAKTPRITSTTVSAN